MQILEKNETPIYNLFVTPSIDNTVHDGIMIN
jgi:hypothetical protein